MGYDDPDRMVGQLMKKYPDIKAVSDIVPPVGYANAYDAMHLTALAIGIMLGVRASPRSPHV